MTAMRPCQEGRAAGQLDGLQDEEQEAQEGPRGLVREGVGEQLASAWCGVWLADDGYPEAGCGEGVGHRVQRPVPVRQHGALAAEGTLLGPLEGREIVGTGTDQLEDDGMI